MLIYYIEIVDISIKVHVYIFISYKIFYAYNNYLQHYQLCTYRYDRHLPAIESQIVIGKLVAFSDEDWLRSGLHIFSVGIFNLRMIKEKIMSH